MNYLRLERDIMSDEGYRAQPYQDTLGNWTIGYGATRLFGEDVTESTREITKAEAIAQLRNDIYGALISVGQLVPNIRAIDAARQEVIVNMIFNLGATGFMKFVKMRRALLYNSYDRAASEMLDSKWATQVPNRAKRLAQQMRSGISNR